MEFFKIRRTIPFMRYALIFNVISLVTFLAAVFFLVHRGLNYSIEFTGGTLVEVGYQHAADVDAVRRTLEKAGYKAEAQNFGSSREVLIRMHLEANQSSSDVAQKVMGVLKQQDASAELRRVEFVGPQVGAELVDLGLVALLVTGGLGLSGTPGCLAWAVPRAGASGGPAATSTKAPGSAPPRAPHPRARARNAARRPRRCR